MKTQILINFKKAMLLGIATCIFGIASAFSQNAPATLASPDGSLVIAFQTLTDKQAPSTEGRLVYTVTFKGKLLIEPSALLLNLKDQPALGQSVHIADVIQSSTDEMYKLVAGKVSSARNHFNAIRIKLEETGSLRCKLEIEARAYDDAVAFRYIVPEQPSINEFRLVKEGTEFRVSKDAVTYALELPNYRSMYESEFVKLPISAFSNQGGIKSSVLLGLPLLMEVPGIAWIAITEADMRGYASMYLVNPSGSWTGHWLESLISPQVDNPDVAVVGTLPHHSPWRVLMVAAEPGKLIESNVITSLNPEPAIKDVSWIHPGKAAWDWWGGSAGPDGKKAFTTATMKYYIDFAAKSGLEYMLVDAGWSDRNDILKMNGRVDIPELVKYGASKNVKIWIWAHYLPVDKQLEEAYTLFESWGVAGVKTDFIERDDQYGIEFYYRVAECAAKHHLMMDFHGSTKPTGMQRTFPNVMGYEGVLGMEQSKAGARDNPDHHVMLPFTRMLPGLMDYTPGGFDNVTKEDFVPNMDKPMVMGSRAHHLAMYVVYEAPSQMVSDRPTNYENQPAFEFIKKVPSSWDEVKVINGLPGEYITIARRKGNEWYLGSMTNWTPRQFDIPLSFLGDGKYTAEIYADAPGADRLPKNVTISTKNVNSKSSLKLELVSGGGCAIRFVPVK